MHPDAGCAGRPGAEPAVADELSCFLRNSELPGPRHASRASPLWPGLGAYFYSGDPAAAEAKLGEAWRSHLAALLPRQTLYLSFLSAEAQAAVGQMGASGLVAAAAAGSLGFADSSHVRIDDGGPMWGLRLR